MYVYLYPGGDIWLEVYLQNNNFITTTSNEEDAEVESKEAGRDLGHIHRSPLYLIYLRPILGLASFIAKNNLEL